MISAYLIYGAVLKRVRCLVPGESGHILRELLATPALIGGYTKGWGDSFRNRMCLDRRLLCNHVCLVGPLPRFGRWDCKLENITMVLCLPSSSHAPPPTSRVPTRGVLVFLALLLEERASRFLLSLNVTKSGRLGPPYPDL